MQDFQPGSPSEPHADEPMYLPPETLPSDASPLIETTAVPEVPAFDLAMDDHRTSWELPTPDETTMALPLPPVHEPAPSAFLSEQSPPSEPAPRRHTSATARAGLVGGLVGALVAGGVAFGTVKLTDKPAATTTKVVAGVPLSNEASPSTLATAPAKLTGKALDIHQLISAVSPSVVAVEIGTQRGNGSVTPVAAGSGVIISTDGLILTNAHVVNITDDLGRTITNEVITVTMADGKSRKVKVLGTDAAKDIGLLQLDDTSGITPATLGSSTSLQVGDDVVAIGNALNLGDTPSVTKGIVSAKNRSLQVDASTTLEDLIQTDAAINHGNSGGPLLNAAGEVVGINSAGIPNSQNIGFAIGIDSIKPIIEQLKTGKSAPVTPKPRLGVTLQDGTTGVVVTGVASGSGAETAGIKVDDVITAVDGKTIGSSDELGAAIKAHKPGDKISITLDRAGKSVTVTATLGTATA